MSKIELTGTPTAGSTIAVSADNPFPNRLTLLIKDIAVRDPLIMLGAMSTGIVG